MIGGKNQSTYLFNESHIIKNTEKFVAKNFKVLDKEIFRPAEKIFKETEKQVRKIQPKIKIEPANCLDIILKIYPKYFSSIGVYNCFWRYIGNDESKGKLSAKYIENIAKNREKIASLYPNIEKIIQPAFSVLGKKNKFDGDLLRYLTFFEMKEFLKKGTIGPEKLKELAARRKKSFYLFIEQGSKEYIVSQERIIKDISKVSFKIDKFKITSIKGHGIYPGLVRGIVYNLTDSPDKWKKIKSRFILVVSMTHPKDIMVVKKSAAIVTDEGGILSHAAIVSRELQKPCVIATKVATKVFKTGDKIEVDANIGTVRRI